ncbi:MAG: DUF5667 domain-containing protein [Dehalococcoidia bacterium]|nr:DUF5667 domain-containing protein [Dehalococcoidia bacterium]
MGKFEDHLNECLTALLNGERTVEECLALYPEEARRLEPLLRTGLSLKGALQVEPRAAFAEAARGRLLEMSGQSLSDALNAGPRPSFARAARQRFLAAAQKMFEARQRWRFPLPAPSLRALSVTVSAVVIVFFSLGTFLVATSGDALPGDWRYPVKRASENVRMTFTFDGDARRDLRLSLASERLSEIEELAKRGRSIDAGLLKDLRGQTASALGSLNASQIQPEKAKEIVELAKKQKEVLASVQPLVAPEDQELLKAAEETSDAAYVKAAQAMALALFEEKSGAAAKEVQEKKEESPVESKLKEAQEGTDMPIAPVPAEGGSTAEAPSETLSPEPPEAAASPPLAVIEHGVDEGGVTWTWDRVVIGRFSVKVPGEGSGWHFVGFDFSGDNTAPAPNMLRLANADNTAVVVINPRSGDTFWYQYKDGLFDEFIVRVAVSGDVWQASPEALSAFHATNGLIVMEIVNSIEIEPPPTATPAPAATSTPEGTATVAAEGSTTASPRPSP